MKVTSIGNHPSLATPRQRTPSLKPLDCGRRITDSLIGQNVTILNHEHNPPRSHRLIPEDKATVTS